MTGTLVTVAFGLDRIRGHACRGVLESLKGITGVVETGEVTDGEFG